MKAILFVVGIAYFSGSAAVGVIDTYNHAVNQHRAAIAAAVVQADAE